MPEIVDIRDRLPRPGPGAAGRSAPKTSVTLHYNGPPVALANGVASHEAWIEHFIGIARYHIQKVWGYTAQGRPIYGSGIMYHLGFIPDGTIFQLRDDDEVLWHCANQTGNEWSRACHFPLGGSQNATTRQWAAFTSYCDDQTERKSVYGHREWKKYTIVKGKQVEVPNSTCPGDILFPRLAAWRRSEPAPEPPQDMVYLTNRVTARVREGPSTDYPTALIMPEGTTAGYDPVPTIGQAIDGNDEWNHRSDERGFVWSGLLVEPT